MSIKLDRVNKQIYQNLVSIFTYEITDPRLSVITIQDVITSKDLTSTKIYYYIENIDSKMINNLLIKATPFIRRKLSGLLRIRVVPRLIFVYDETPNKAKKIETILKNISYSDQNTEDIENNYTDLED